MAGEDLWAAVIEHLNTAKPMAATSVAKAVFVGDDGKTFTVALSPDEAIAKSMISGDRVRLVIEDFIAKSLGPRKLNVEAREGITPAAPPPELAEVEEPPLEHEPPPTSAPAPATETAPPPAEPNPEEIYNDPLIKEAVDLFEAEIKG